MTNKTCFCGDVGHAPCWEAGTKEVLYMTPQELCKDSPAKMALHQSL